MKISNNALNFLLAQYRAIFKRAYIKGIASAVILTAGLAAGQAQATASDTNSAFTTTNDSTWTAVTSGAITANGSRLAGDYDTGNAEDTTNTNNGDGIVSGEGLVLGSGDSVTSGSAYAGYVSLASGTTLDAVAENNTLTLESGATINTSGGNVVGGWAKTNGDGTATATGNKLIVNAGVTLSGSNSFIGAVAAGLNGAKAEGNTYTFIGDQSGTALTMSGGNFGATVFVGADATNQAKQGTFEALNNTLEMSNFNISGDSATLGEKTFVGGNVQILGLAADNSIEVVRAQGNTVNLDNFQIGSTSGSVVGNIAANYVTFDKSVSGASVALVEANGDGDTGVILNNGTIYGATVFGGMAQNQSGGAATASNNSVSITDTNLLSASGGAVGIAITGGHAESTISSSGQKIALNASNNTVTIDNAADDITKTKYQVQGTVFGSKLSLNLASGASGITDLVGSTLTADNNTVTINEGVELSAGSIHGVYFNTNTVSGGSGTIASGGATLHASNNTITLNGNWTADADQTIATVVGEAGLMTAENNKLVINGEVEGKGAFIAAVIASAQPDISGKVGSGTSVPNVHQLSNNSVEIGASAVVNDAKIYAAQSTNTKAYTLNNDVSIAGKVTNSDIYGGTGADSLVDVQAGSRLTYSAGTSSASGTHTISSDNVDLGGVISVGQYDTLQVKGFANDGNNNAGKYNTNLTNIESHG